MKYYKFPRDMRKIDFDYDKNMRLVEFERNRERIKNGISHYDAYDLDCFLLDIIPKGLDILADGVSRPAAYESVEEWHKTITKLSDEFKELNNNYDNPDFQGNIQEEVHQAFKHLADIFLCLWS